MHVLSVSALKGGVGKTTITLGLASAAMARGLRTLVVDLDPQCNSSTGLGAVGEYEYSVAEVIKRPRHNTVLKAIVASTWAKGQTGKLDVLLGQPKLTEIALKKPTFKQLWHLEQGLAEIESDYDLVLIDTPPSINSLTRMAWVASDRVLLVTEPSFNSLLAVDQGLKALSEIRKQVNRQVSLYGILVNRLRPTLAEHQFRLNELEDLYGAQICDVVFEEKSALTQSQGAGRAIHTWPGQSAAKIAGLFDELLEDLLNAFISDDQKRSPVNKGKRDRSKFASRSITQADKKQTGRRSAKKLGPEAERIEMVEIPGVSPEYVEKFNETLRQAMTDKQIKELKKPIEED